MVYIHIYENSVDNNKSNGTDPIEALNAAMFVYSGSEF